MAQVIAKNKVRSRVNKSDVLLNEMKRRKSACLNKLQKLSDRINILEQFKNEAKGSNISFKNYLKSKGYDYRDVFTPMGYFSPNCMVVSDDNENEYLTYHKGMIYNENAGYYTPDRASVSQKDHEEMTSSILGMTWNPALNRYFPTTVFDTKAFTSSEEMGDSGMDIVGGLKTEDFGNLTNENEYGQELVSMVQGFLEEEFDNVEDELDIIEEAEMKLNGFSNFESAEDTRKVKSGKNLACRTGCATKHPFNKTKRQQCEAKCDEKYKSSQKQERRREERDERKEAREEFRSDKKSCKERLKKGEIQQWQYKECVKKERKEKRSEIKDAGGNVLVRTWRATAVVNPLTASSRGGVLVLVGDNTWGFATRLAPALLPDAEAKELFKPEAIESAKKGWKKVANGYRNMGGDPEKLKSKVIQGYKKKPYKVSKKSSFEGEVTYEFEEHSNFEAVSGATTAYLIIAGVGALGSLVSAFTKAGGQKNPYKDDKTPQDYKNALADGTVETNPETDENAPVLNEKGEWIEPSTGKAIDPITGKYKDTIFGVNKWVVIGVGALAVFGLYYVLKGKK
jgi:hypothetical protein